MESVTANGTAVVVTTTIIHHLMILVHGIMGNAGELGYVQQALQRELEQRQSNGGSTVTKLVVHSATCNEADSLDGIEAGGVRLAQEINHLLREYFQDEILPLLESNKRTDTSEHDHHHQQQQQQQKHTIALSFLGFSLGGLYSRYSLPFIDWNISAEENNHSIAVVPNLFATVATPHLGIQHMTYWNLPSCLEPVVAWYLGQTGRDLFRRPRKRCSTVQTIDTNCYKDVIQQMSLDPMFLLPLSKFQKRLAMANAFSTDFAVHTATAAFLTDDDDDHHCNEEIHNHHDSDGSEILHSSAHFILENESLSTTNEKHSASTKKAGDDSIIPHFPSVRFVTSRSWSPDDESIGSSQEQQQQQQQQSCDVRGDIGDSDETGTCQRPLLDRNVDGSMSDMANSLNSLGWTKIFVDVRSHIPALWSRPKTSSQDILITEQDETGLSTQKRIYSPSALKRKLSGRGFDFNTLPFGHSFLVASTKNWWYTWFYRDGRNFVDQVLASELVEELLLFNDTK
ncbi:DUF676 putative serine esterase domain containing protein [Nitzschia inconspicua]|uniref:DUF676 putative serine esterase domain containing protein n=1 Tax=Nitzschia inconspicua TaxID=303405 RepID=A0A9K3KL41_9STRA|nr:DUF676 putative serine esterase domain containing protein [Nitzschia inconspicua]